MLICRLGKSKSMCWESMGWMAKLPWSTPPCKYCQRCMSMHVHTNWWLITHLEGQWGSLVVLFWGFLQNWMVWVHIHKKTAGLNKWDDYYRFCLNLQEKINMFALLFIFFNHMSNTNKYSNAYCCYKHLHPLLYEKYTSRSKFWSFDKWKGKKKCSFKYFMFLDFPERGYWCC